MMLDTDEKRVLVELEEEDGSVQTYELIDLIEYQKVSYGVFFPTETTEGEVVILQLTGEDEEKAENYTLVEDDDLADTVFDLFRATNPDYFSDEEEPFSLEELRES